MNCQVLITVVVNVDDVKDEREADKRVRRCLKGAKLPSCKRMVIIEHVGGSRIIDRALALYKKDAAEEKGIKP